mgnify:CR=1 FL=1
MKLAAALLADSAAVWTGVLALAGWLSPPLVVIAPSEV